MQNSIMLLNNFTYVNLVCSSLLFVNKYNLYWRITEYLQLTVQLCKIKSTISIKWEYLLLAPKPQLSTQPQLVYQNLAKHKSFW